MLQFKKNLLFYKTFNLYLYFFLFEKINIFMILMEIIALYTIKWY